MATIKIPTPLRSYTDGQSEIPVEGANVGEVLKDLINRHPDLQKHLFDGDRLRNFVNVFIGDEDVRYRDGLETEVTANDRLRLIPSIAGGDA